MRLFKLYATRVMFVALSAAMVTLSSCSSDDPASVADPTIVVTPATATAAPGETVTFNIAVVAPGTLASVTLDGTEIKAFTTETTSAFTYEYTVDGSEASGDKTLTFVVTDKQGAPKTATQAVTLTVDPGNKVMVTEAISANTTWTADKYYILKGNIYVESGAELTIEPGTVVLGDKVSKGSLIVSRGAKIHAKGTAAKPIIFTSSAPKGFRNYGDWGGVVLLGKAQNNQSASQKIEGISAASGDNGLYGGTADDDSSGEFYYARIEFAGIALSTDNELNGLTFGSVGSGTEVHHVQVSYSGDDSYEWFGGTVNVDHLVAYRGWDDDFDTDFGYRGNVQYCASFRDPNIADKSGSNGFESDNDGSGSANTPKTNAKFANITWYGPFVYAALSSGALKNSNASNNFQFGGHLRRNSDIEIYNSVLVGSQLEAVHLDKTGANAKFINNYIGRYGVSVSNALLKTTDGNGIPGGISTNFVANNLAEASGATVDLSAKLAGMSAAMDINNPSALLASGSSLLTAGGAVPAGLVAEDYIGAFDDTNNWMTGWTEFDPINKDYGN